MSLYATNRATGISGQTIHEFPTMASFPAAPADGYLALDLSTDILYVYNASLPGYVAIAGPGAVLSIGTIDSATPSSDGAVISVNDLVMQSASATVPGLVNNSAQTFAGQKTFSTGLTGTLTGSASLNVLTSALGNLTDVATDGITITGGTGAVVGSVSIAQQASDATHNGYLSSTDWSTFNGKQPTGNYITALTGDVVATGPGSVASTIQSNVVSNAKLAQMPTLALKGNNTGGTANALDLTVAQVNAILPVFTSGLNGLVPASGGGTTNFLRADGTFAAPPAGTGTVTSVSVASANGLAGTVATATTTPAITLSTTVTGILEGNGTAISAASTTGSGAVVLATSPTLVTPALGTPTAVVLTSATGLPLTTGVTGQLPIANGGTGQATKAAGFDALSPMTTGGDLIYGGASGTGTRLANGSSGQFLRSNGTTLAPSWATPGSVAVNAQTASYTLLITDSTVTFDASGGSRNATLPTAVGFSGLTFTIKKIDSTVNTVALLTTSSQTIDGSASGALTLATQNESVTLESDGANWIILVHKTFNSTGSLANPSSSITNATITNYKAHREGDCVRIMASWAYTGASSLDAIAPAAIMPGGTTVDTTKLGLTNNNVAALGTSYAIDSGVADYNGFVQYVSNTVIFNLCRNTSNGTPFTPGNTDAVSINLLVPVTGWFA